MDGQSGKDVTSYCLFSLADGFESAGPLFNLHQVHGKLYSVNTVIELRCNIFHVRPQLIISSATKSIAQRDLQTSADGEVNYEDDHQEDSESHQDGGSVEFSWEAGQTLSAVEMDKAAESVNHTTKK